eukprot:TRINITY_DN9752_c0_g1_i2.p1 TRINITY_DN9752_c0_g1~~TRINITY_DN9752_c0_g1_i2.p1  ORF type:complete len:159 (-),score=27.52 TRINITY_DN9752_c0_g1_i2:4-480(-)
MLKLFGYRYHNKAFRSLRLLLVDLPIKRAYTSKAPSSLKYTKSHEWIKPPTNSEEGIVGITDYAQETLGEIIYLDLPDLGSVFQSGDAVGAVESVKATFDICSPVSGTVTQVNTRLVDEPALVNSSPFDDGWVFKIKLSDTKELENLMDASTYQKELV